MNPDVIILADTIHTMEGSSSGGPAPQAVAVEGGVIAAVGSRDDAENWPAAEVIDFGAAVLTPGLVDCHMHPVFGLELTRGTTCPAPPTLPACAHCCVPKRKQPPQGTGCGAGALTPMCSDPPLPTAN